MKRYYLPFEPSADVNYLQLFELMEKAEYNTERKAFDTIPYASIPKLAEQLTFSASTLNRILSNKAYTPFLSIDKENKVITLNNSFSNSSNREKKPFIVLTQEEVQLLKQYNDNLLCKYLIYTKYYCGYSKNKVQDFTASQFLVACGYASNSNSNKDKISSYNTILSKSGFLQIESYRDNLGHKRNRYKYNF